MTTRETVAAWGEVGTMGLRRITHCAGTKQRTAERLGRVCGSARVSSQMALVISFGRDG